MEEEKVVKATKIDTPGVTPITKRIGIICLAAVAISAVAGSAFGRIPTNDAVLITVAIITAIASLLDGGK